MPDFLTLSMCFYRVCERRNLPLKAQKSQIWAGGNAGVKLNSTCVSVENRPRVWNCGSFTSTWFSSMNLSHCRLDKIEWKSVSIYRSRSSTRAPCLYLLGHKKPLSDLIFRNPKITKIERIKKMKAKACLKFHDKLNATKHMVFKTSYL